MDAFHPNSLKKLRDGLVSALTWIGIANLVLILAGSAVISFALDYAFELPWLVRAAVLVAVAVAYIVVIRRNHRRLRVDVTTSDLLATVEARHPELRGHLLNAVDFARELKSRDAESDPDALGERLLNRAAKESAVALGQVKIERCLDLSPLRRRAALALVLVAVVCGLGVLLPREFFFWGKRNLLLSTTPWPRQTHFAIDRDGTVWHHPRTDPLQIDAWVVGDIPRSVELAISSSGDTREMQLVPGPSEERTWELDSAATFGGPAAGERAEGKRLSYHIPRVSQSFSFEFSGGDNQSVEVEVEVHDRPRMESCTVALTYPPHTGLDRKLTDNPVTSLSALRGTQIDIAILADAKVTSAWSRFGDAGRVPIDAIEDRTIQHGFRLEESGFLEISFRGGEHDFECAKPIRFAFVAYDDISPSVTLDIEGESRELAPEAVLSYAVEASDDFGVKDVYVELTRLSATTADRDGDATGPAALRIDLDPWEMERTDDGVRVAVEAEMALTSQRLEPGAQFTLQAFVVDNDEPGGFKKSSSVLETFTVTSPQELLDKLDRIRNRAVTRLEDLAYLERALLREENTATTGRTERSPRRDARDAAEPAERADADRSPRDSNNLPFEDTPRRSPNAETTPPGEQQPGAQQPNAQQPGEQQPGEQQPNAQQPGEQQPGAQQPNAQQPGEQQPGAQQPNAQQPGEQQPGAQQPNAQQPGEQQPGEQQPNAQQPGEQQPGAQQPNAQQPGEQQPGAQQPNAQQPGEQQPGEQQPNAQQPGEQQPGAQQPNAQQPGEQQPGEQQPNAQQPGEQQPGEQQPNAQQPGEQQPGEQQPNAQQPGEQQPGEQQPNAQQPGEQQPGEQQPNAQQPGEQQPGEQQPNAQQPGEQQPGEQQPNAQQPGEQQPGEQQPNAQQPGEQQPGEQQPNAQQPGEQQPGEQQPNAQQPGEQQPRSPQETAREEAQRRAEETARRQQEISEATRRVAEDLEKMARELERNRLVSEAELRRFREEVARPLDELTERRLPDSAREIENLPESEKPDEDRDAAKENVRDIARELELVAKRLEGTRKFRDVLNRMKLIIEIQRDVIDETNRELDDKE